MSTADPQLAPRALGDRSQIVARLREASAAGPGWPGDRDLSGAQLDGEDLSGLDLSGWDLSGARLCRADLSGTTLLGADLSGCELFGAKLEGAQLLNARLVGADLTEAQARQAGFGGADLSEATLFNADLSEATLAHATLRDADARAVGLRGARLREVDLRDADLDAAILADADLTSATLDGASLRDTDLRGARLRGIRGYDRARWVGTDILGADFCHAYMARREIMDQNYIYEFRNRSRMNSWLYWIWWASSDCGRSMLRWSLWIGVVIAVFAGLYSQLSIDYGDHPTTLSSFYFSVVTLTTLGYGDVLPASGAAQVAAMVEVAIGYMMLGGLLAILSNKMARRAE